jgi:pathogenesis-related protein 1
MKSFLCLLLLISHYSWSQSASEFTGSIIKPTDAQKFLDHHNKVRAAVKVDKLTWSPRLAKYAQQWAQHLAEGKRCKMIHSDCIDEYGNIFGENLFWGSDASAFNSLDASKSWYEEKLNYSYELLGDSRQKDVGHYTQMIWRNTREVGVGIGYCKSGGIIIVASYFPAGNHDGEYPY